MTCSFVGHHVEVQYQFRSCRVIEQPNDGATIAIQINSSTGEWLKTIAGLRKGCLLSSTLFNIFLEKIMSDALDEYDGKVTIAGRNVTNLQFSDRTDALSEKSRNRSPS